VQDPQLTIWTIGHSTRSAEEFNQILIIHGIENLVDVRTFPGSRRHSQFNRDQLSNALAAIAINYHHLPGLGGRRQPSENSKNIAWKNSSFRGYADHMESAEFKKGIEILLELARVERTAIMCAEAVWWRCHRGLIADYLKASDVDVVHIIDEKHIQKHPYTTAARIVDGRLSYQGLLEQN
jgi:uncharacterized protein (DUF488 family)